MAERYFTRQGTIPRRLTTEALLGLARCAVARGDVAREEFGRTRVIVDPAADVYRAIVAADGVATYFSTIALEAFALKRPVYVIDPFDAPPALDFAAAGLGARIRAAAELRAGMAAVLAGEACRGTIHDDPCFAVLQDGRSAERIVAILERMIGEAAMPGAA